MPLCRKLFTVESVASAFKGAKKKDIEGFLEGFAALGVLTVFEGPVRQALARCWAHSIATPFSTASPGCERGLR